MEYSPDMKLTIRYNSPVVLSYAFAVAAVLLLDQFLQAGIVATFFTLPGRNGFNSSSGVHYLTLFTHPIGHLNWDHLTSNLAFILLLGPILEEKCGSISLFLMMVVTAVATGIINILFFVPSLLGGSGIVFMMILLSSITNIRSREIPLTFILIVIFYLYTEVANAFRYDEISQFAHILGGFLGGFFGFLNPKKR